MAIIYSATRYRNDPRVFDHYDIFNREKAKEDLNRWKKQIENSEEGEALERVSMIQCPYLTYWSIFTISHVRIGVAPITYLPTCIIKISAFKGVKVIFHTIRNCS